MDFPLALLQASDNMMMLVLLAVFTLGVMIALGKRFFVGIFEVVTAPQASLGYHGKENTLFFSVMIVFLGGLIGLVYLTFQQPQISSDLSSFAKTTGQAIAQGNSNPTYRPIAGEMASSRIDNVLQTYVVGNFQWFPVYMIAVWLLTGLLFWACAKMFGTQTSLSAFLGALSFPYFFSAIASALSLPESVKSMTGALFLQPAQPSLGPAMIVASVLSLYAFILFCMAVVQSAEISAGQFIVCLLLIAIVVGGANYYFLTQQFMKQAEAFSGEITAFDPSQSGGGGSAPPPDMSEPAPKADTSSDEGLSAAGGDE